MNFMKTRIQLVLLSSVLAMPTLPHRQSTMLQVLLPSGHRTTKSFDINLANLRQFNIYEADVPRLLAVLDQDDQIQELMFDGVSLPINNERTVTSVLVYSYPGPNNTQLYVTREYFANRSMHELHADEALQPLHYSVIWGYETDVVNATDVELHSWSSGATIEATEVGTILEEHFSSIFIKNYTMSILAPPEGLHLRVLSLTTRKVVLEGYASTAQPYSVTELLTILRHISKGRLVMLTSLIDSTASISSEERAGLEALGSSMVQSLKFLDVWCWVWISGGATLLESVSQAGLSKTRFTPMMAPPLSAHLQGISTGIDDASCQDWPMDEHYNTRRRFCLTYEGYHKLCHCQQPYVTKETHTQSSWRERIAVLVLTKDRPRYLYRLLRKLLSQPGLQLRDILCCVDGTSSDETLHLLKLFNVTTVVHKPEGTTSTAKIARHVRFSLFTGLQHFKDKAEKFIILEDDLIPAPDFYSYMQQTSELLDRDPTIYAVTAYNAHAFPHTAHNTSRLYRDDSFPSIGWMVSRRFIEEVLPLWPISNSNYDWDFWMGSSLVRLNRSVVVPEVPRVRHGGLTGGVHVGGPEATYLLREKPVTSHVDNTVDIESVLDVNYERESVSLLHRAKILELSDNGTWNFPKEGPDDVYLINIVGFRDDDRAAFRLLAHDLGIWCWDNRGSRNGMWRIPYYNTTLLVMALPFSKHRNVVVGHSQVTTKHSTSAMSGTDDDVLDMIREMAELSQYQYLRHRPADYKHILFT